MPPLPTPDDVSSNAILVVHSDAHVRANLGRAIVARGLAFIAACDGLEALALIAEEKPPLAVMLGPAATDAVLPAGAEALLKRLASAPTLSRVPVLLVRDSTLPLKGRMRVVHAA